MEYFITIRKTGRGGGVFFFLICFVFCFYKHKRAFPQIEGIVLFVVWVFGSPREAKPKFLLFIIQKPRIKGSRREEVTSCPKSPCSVTDAYSSCLVLV